MATYKGIQGYSVQSLASDPSPTANVEGQLWFNSTSSTYKISMAGSGAWASGGNRNTRCQGAPGTGSQTAAFTAGGTTESPGVLTTNSETYNGTAWTELANLATGVYNGSAGGTATSALLFGGTTSVAPTATTTSWDGTSWSIVTSLPAVNVHMAECIGTSNSSSLCVGGGLTPIEAKNQSYNGTSWTELAGLNTGRSSASGNGTTTAALIYGGSENPPLQDATETWNGTSWAEVADLVNARETCASAMQGSTTSTLVFSGSSPAAPVGHKTFTEEWNGTSWTEVADLATGRSAAGGSGTASAALCFGGQAGGTPTIMNTTEAWNSPVYSVKTVTTS